LDRQKRVEKKAIDLVAEIVELGGEFGSRKIKEYLYTLRNIEFTEADLAPSYPELHPKHDQESTISSITAGPEEDKEPQEVREASEPAPPTASDHGSLHSEVLDRKKSPKISKTRKVTY